MLPAESDMVRDMEAIEGWITTSDWGKDEEELRGLLAGLEKAYRRREKIISRIMKLGTGYESEEALRMYDPDLLERWAKSLENFRSEKLKK